MQIIPAIDLQAGTCVRLKQGQFDQMTSYTATAKELAQQYLQAGAQRLHIVDLDGARQGKIQQLAEIKTLALPGLNLQVGGGIRSLDTALACKEAGIDYLVIGSLALQEPKTTQAIIQTLGAAQIVLALDVSIENGTPYPVYQGWETRSSRPLWEVVSDYAELGIKDLLCTDISCDGMMAGPNFQLYEEACQRFPTINWQASGGIRHLEDIKALAQIGTAAAILGRTLYESEFSLADFMRASQSC